MDPLTWLTVLLAALGIAASLWLLRDRDRLRAELAETRVERDLARARVAHDEEAKNHFQAVAGEVLRNSNEEFLKLAREALVTRETHAIGEIDKRRDAIDGLLAPIHKALEKACAEIVRVERGNVGLREQVDRMREANQSLRQETSKLSQALRKPNVRGRYGEIQLERVVELAGMRPYCDFVLQEYVRDEKGQLLKPDLIVRLPNERLVAVDAKTSIDSFLDALDAENEEDATAHLERYAESVQTQIQRLSRKEYWAQFDVSPELVVMFVPGDQLVDAALERRPKLIELAAQLNIVIASPSTLIGLLRAIHVGWREKSLSDSAQELFQLGRELHERAAVAFRHAASVGESLGRARESYNRFVRSVDTRLYPTLRKFAERGARSSKELVDLAPIESDILKLGVTRQDVEDLLLPLPPREEDATPAPGPASGG